MENLEHLGACEMLYVGWQHHRTDCILVANAEMTQSQASNYHDKTLLLL